MYFWNIILIFLKELFAKYCQCYILLYISDVPSAFFYHFSFGIKIWHSVGRENVFKLIYSNALTLAHMSSFDPDINAKMTPKHMQK